MGKRYNTAPCNIFHSFHEKSFESLKNALFHIYLKLWIGHFDHFDRFSFSGGIFEMTVTCKKYYLLYTSLQKFYKQLYNFIISTLQ